MVDYLRMTSLEDVTEMLWADGPQCLLMAGGTDILTRPEPFGDRKILLDIGRVEELKGVDLVEETAGAKRIRIGAGTSHQDLVDHPLIYRRARLLALACASVGSIQIRNRGTIGGNLGNASPAGDSIPALACLDAQVEVLARGRRRTVDVLSLFKGPAELTTGFDELIASILVPSKRRAGRTVAFFKKAGQRRGMCCSKASVAFCARRHTDGRLTGVRFALGAVTPVVVRVPRAEQALEGRVLDAEAIRDAARACSRSVRAIDDIRSTADYRRRVAGALATEGLLEILGQMQKPGKKRRRRR